MESFRDTLISKWENAYGERHKGEIEIDSDKCIPYWSDQFVEDLINYAEKLFQKSKLLETQMKILRDEFKE